MAWKNEVKLNKNHQGKEFQSEFRFIGQIKQGKVKDRDTESWVDQDIYEEGLTKTGKPIRFLRFVVETAKSNELKVELMGMEKFDAYLYSSTHRKSHKVKFEDRFNKKGYPDESYHLIETEFDKTLSLSEIIKPGMWAEVQGHYEFSSFEDNEGLEKTFVKRVVDRFFPLKNGLVAVNGLVEKDEIRIYDAATEGRLLGKGKANKEGLAQVKVGWLTPEGGKLYLCKVTGDKETVRSEFTYTDGTVVPNEKITIINNVESDVAMEGEKGKRIYVPYVRDFKDENFFEVNNFKMQIGIGSTYQEEKNTDTKVNGVFLGYGKHKSTPYKVELTVEYKEATDGKDAFANAFARLNRYDLLAVSGIDNNRNEYVRVAIEDTEEDNPFANIAEKETQYEMASAGTKRGLYVLNYVDGSYKRDALTEDEYVAYEEPKNDDPFASAVNIDSSDLPF